MGVKQAGPALDPAAAHLWLAFTRSSGAGRGARGRSERGPFSAPPSLSGPPVARERGQAKLFAHPSRRRTSGYAIHGIPQASRRGGDSGFSNRKGAFSIESAAERITGWKAGTGGKAHPFRLYARSRGWKNTRTSRRLAAGGDVSFRFERDILKPDGQIVSVEVYISKVFKERRSSGIGARFGTCLGPQVEAVRGPLPEPDRKQRRHDLSPRRARAVHLPQPLSEDLTGYKPEELIRKALRLRPDAGFARDCEGQFRKKGMAGELPRSATNWSSCGRTARPRSSSCRRRPGTRAAVPSGGRASSETSPSERRWSARRQNWRI